MPEPGGGRGPAGAQRRQRRERLAVRQREHNRAGVGAEGSVFGAVPGGGVHDGAGLDLLDRVPQPHFDAARLERAVCCGGVDVAEGTTA